MFAVVDNAFRQNSIADDQPFEIQPVPVACEESPKKRKIRSKSIQSDGSSNFFAPKSPLRKRAPKPLENQKHNQTSSLCRSYEINHSNPKYITDTQAVMLLQETKFDVFPTLEDFERNLISRLNKASSMIQYKYKLTDKYAVLICTCCKKFAYWYKNADGIDMHLMKQNDYKDANLI